MHLHHCRCFQEHLRMLLHTLGALCKPPEGGWEHLEVLRSTREGYGSVWEVCVWLPDEIAFGWCWLHRLHLWGIGHGDGHPRYCVIVCLRFFWTQPHLTTSLSRRHLWHLSLYCDNIKNQHKLSQSCQWWCGSCCDCLGLHNCRKLQFSCPIHDSSLTEVVSYVPPYRLA